jgi:hypothetical protein
MTRHSAPLVRTAHMNIHTEAPQKVRITGPCVASCSVRRDLLEHRLLGEPAPFDFFSKS